MILFALAACTSHAVFAQPDSPHLSVERLPGSLQLSWPSTTEQANGSILRPWFELQRSIDLQSWKPMGERFRATAGAAGELYRVNVDIHEPRAFYRLLSVTPPGSANLGAGGAEVFGYEEAFARELESIGQISAAEFAEQFASSANYLPGISRNPTNAAYWNAFNADIAVVNQGKAPGSPGYRTLDYRLNADEFGRFQQNGFVVSERLEQPSFGAAFYQLWHNDLPVFISTDAILQAWHRTYDAMLEEVEETYLFNAVETMLAEMAAQVPDAAGEAGAGLSDSLLDADYFLAVARSLLAGAPVATRLNQDARVAETLTDVRAEQLKQVENFLGFCRVVDFSQFKVRGHYDHSERLRRYFQCVMWLGRIDLPVAGGPFRRCPGIERFASPRELGTAIVLWRLVNTAGQFESWRNMEQIIGTFVGWTDSMTFGQLGGLLAGAGVRTLADVPDLARLERIQAEVARGELGAQNITSDWFAQPLGVTTAYGLPKTFTVLGQKFVPDSWAFSQTVFNNIQWVEQGITNLMQRRVPGALDVAFAVLKNNQVVPDLAAQMTGTFADSNRPHALAFRDGKPYQHNLAAVRAVMNSQSPEAWESNIYMNWLACLRELSAPTTDTHFSEAMRTRAWAMKTLTTQLASWTQLRHDTILYAKQSYSLVSDSCSFPAGFVEPRVEFWGRLQAMANAAADLIGALPYRGGYPTTINVRQTNQVTGQLELVLTTNLIPLVTIQSNQVSHLRRFADTVGRLQTMAQKELAQESFSTDEELFIRNLIQQVGWLTVGCARGPAEYDGWYPKLFYRAVHWSELDFHQEYGAGAFDALVADVHTDVPCPDCEVPDPGSVLHEAVGRVNLLLIAVEHGTNRFVCAGPVLSHYEFEVTGSPRRISDTEWKVGTQLGGDAPPYNLGPSILNGGSPIDVSPGRIEGVSAPVWTRGYLVPKR